MVFSIMQTPVAEVRVHKKYLFELNRLLIEEDKGDIFCVCATPESPPKNDSVGRRTKLGAPTNHPL